MKNASQVNKRYSTMQLIYKNKIFYLYLIPLFIVIIVFGILPIAKSIQMSFTDAGSSLSSNPVYVGFENYKTIFEDKYFLDSLKTTISYTLFSVPLNISVAFVYALFLSSVYLKKGRVFFKLAVFIPVIIPDIVSALVWKWMYNTDFGAINVMLKAVHLPAFGGIANPKSVIFALMILELWKHVGFYVIIFLTNLQLIDKSMFEAADLDGANYFQKVHKIILPELKPALTINFVYAVIQFLKTFTVSMVMTQGGPNYKSNFVSYYAYNKFRMAEYGEATAMATILFIIVICFTIFAYKINRSD